MKYNINGITKPLCVWEEENDLNSGVIYKRIKRGWSEDELLDPPSPDRNGRFKSKKGGCTNGSI